MMEKLKKCPFCGTKAQIISLGAITNIACGVLDDNSDTCGAVLFGGNKDSKQQMINKWNARQQLKGMA